MQLNDYQNYNKSINKRTNIFRQEENSFIRLLSCFLGRQKICVAGVKVSPRAAHTTYTWVESASHEGLQTENPRLEVGEFRSCFDPTL